MKYIIFGAGNNGRELLKYLDIRDVLYFCDNNPDKEGQFIEGIEIISFSKMKAIYKSGDITLIISVSYKVDIRKQLKKEGIDNYIEYLSEGQIENKSGENNHMQDILYMSEDDMTLVLDKIKEKAQLSDPLKDFDTFLELVKECKEKLKGEYAFYNSWVNESMLYGHAKAMMEYAGIEYDEYSLRKFPIVAHGTGYIGTHQPYKTAGIFTSLCDKKIHNAEYPYIPIWAVGPYIHYAKGIYSNNEIARLHKLYGKTITIFIDHEAEKSRINFKSSFNNFFNKKIDEYLATYERVCVCAYWLDIDKELYTELHNKGIPVISSGFRFDENFIQRQKTIFDLTDDIAVFGNTSPYIYGLFLNKRVFAYDVVDGYSSYNMPSYIPVTRTIDLDEFKKIFYIGVGNCGKTLKEYSKDDYTYLNYYFGFDQIKNADEIKNIYEVSSDIWKEADYDVMKYPIAVYKTYYNYQANHDFYKLKTLTEALGKGFWNQ